MEAHGTSKGVYIFHGDLEKTAAYLTDQEKVMTFNPFCEKVEATDIDNIYKWHFQVTDPRNNPFQVIFFVEQHHEILVALPDDYPYENGTDLPDDLVKEYTVGRKILWLHYPAKQEVNDPEQYVFEGKINAEMSLFEHQATKTKVDFSINIDVTFELYPFFKILPLQIVQKMTNAGMSFIMQTATNRMFGSLIDDFKDRSY